MTSRMLPGAPVAKSVNGTALGSARRNDGQMRCRYWTVEWCW